MNPSKSLLLACALALCATQAFAGPLAVDTTAIVHGSTNFQGFNFDNTPSGLTGYVDWAVYAPGTFPGGFSGFSASDYVYAYQVTETGPAPLSSMTVNVSGPTDNTNIGDFTGNNGFGLVTGAPSDGQPFDYIDPFLTANWNFNNVGGVFGATAGLAYSSPNGPIPSTGFTIDDSTVGFLIPVPAPNPVNAPEPGTLALASCGIGVLVYQWLRRRVRGVIS